MSLEEKKKLTKNMKSHLTLSENTKKKADKLYARYKNYGTTSFPETKSKSELYSESKQLYDKSKNHFIEAERLRKQLGIDNK